MTGVRAGNVDHLTEGHSIGDRIAAPGDADDIRRTRRAQVRCISAQSGEPSAESRAPICRHNERIDRQRFAEGICQKLDKQSRERGDHSAPMQITFRTRSGRAVERCATTLHPIE